MGEVIDQIDRHFFVGVFDQFSIFLEDPVKSTEVGLGLLDLLMKLADELTAR